MKQEKYASLIGGVKLSVIAPSTRHTNRNTYAVLSFYTTANSVQMTKSKLGSLHLSLSLSLSLPLRLTLSCRILENERKTNTKDLIYNANTITKGRGEGGMLYVTAKYDY